MALPSETQTETVDAIPAEQAKIIYIPVAKTTDEELRFLNRQHVERLDLDIRALALRTAQEARAYTTKETTPQERTQELIDSAARFLWFLQAGVPVPSPTENQEV